MERIEDMVARTTEIVKRMSKINCVAETKELRTISKSEGRGLVELIICVKLFIV